MICPCGNELTYSDCCGKYIEGRELPPTPEALMRSRYTAYTLHDLHYIKSTMKGKALIQFSDRSSDNTHQVTWMGLTVISSKMKSERNGFVSFEAKYQIENETFSIKEKSEFRKFGEKWFYIDGRKINR